MTKQLPLIFGRDFSLFHVIRLIFSRWKILSDIASGFLLISELFFKGFFQCQIIQNIYLWPLIIFPLFIIFHTSPNHSLKDTNCEFYLSAFQGYKGMKKLWKSDQENIWIFHSIIGSLGQCRQSGLLTLFKEVSVFLTNLIFLSVGKEVVQRDL